MDMEIVKSDFLDNGFTNGQAVSLVNALAQVREEVVTKEYLHNELAAVSLETRSLKVAVQGEIVELRDSLNFVHKDVEILKHEVSSMKDEISGVKDEMSEVKESVDSLRDEVTSLRKEGNERGKESGELRKEVESLREEGNERGKETIELRKEVAALRNEGVDRANQLTSVRNEMVSFKKDVVSELAKTNEQIDKLRKLLIPWVVGIVCGVITVLGGLGAHMLKLFGL